MDLYTFQEARETCIRALQQARESGCTHIEIVTAMDEHVCQACKDRAKIYKISEVPELPHKECTARPLTNKTEGDTWCRCVYVGLKVGERSIMHPDQIVEPDDRSGCLMSLITSIFK